MGVRGLQSYILAKCPDSLVPVELTANPDKKKRLIVVEGWSCLRSVYGPHMDFICGGQWQEFRASIRRFVNTFQQANCELVVFFAGGIKESIRAEWARKKCQNRDTVNMVMQGLRQRGYAPDRKHFLPNETHPQVFRQVLLNCHVKVISTPYSTDKAMVEYAKKNGAYGILANDSDFIMMNAPRYLSLHHLRISGNTISTVIIDSEKISDSLGLPLSLFPLLSCLLGNDIVNYELLEEFHNRLLKDFTEEDDEDKKMEGKEGLQLVAAVILFLKRLDDEIKENIFDNIPAIVNKVLAEGENTGELEAVFLSGLEQYKESTNSPWEPDPNPNTVVTVSVVEKEKPKEKPKEEMENEHDSDVEEITAMVSEAKIVDDTPRVAQDVQILSPAPSGDEGEVKSEEGAAPKEGAAPGPGTEEVRDEVVEKVIVPEPDSEVPQDTTTEAEVADKVTTEEAVVEEDAPEEQDDEGKKGGEEAKKGGEEGNKDGEEAKKGGEEGKEDEDMADVVEAEGGEETGGGEETEDQENDDEDKESDTPQRLVTLPAITSKVLASASAAHASGTLNTQLFPLMMTGTVSLGPLFEDNKDKDTVSSALLFRAARQRIYGLVFGVGRGWIKPDAKRQRSTKIDSQRQVTVREYIGNGSKRALAEGEEVPAMPVHAPNTKQLARKPTPHIDRLWTGMSAKIQELRRSTLLAIMNCNLPSYFNNNVIANEYLLVCIVLRYVLTTGNKVLREYELDAFLATALSPQLHFGPSHLYKIAPGRLTARGCTLAHIFVRGVETILLANDACNYPVNRRFCFIGNFFDGKLFQFKLGQCRAGLSLLDICDGDPAAVDYFRHLRCIVVEDLPRSVFASPPLGAMGPPRRIPGRGPPMRMPPPPPADFRMKYPPPTEHRSYNNNHGSRGSYRGNYGGHNGGHSGARGGSQHRPNYGHPPAGPYTPPSYSPAQGQYNQSSGGVAGPPYSHGGAQQTHNRPGNNYQSGQQHKQYNNRRYPSNYQQNDSYQQDSYTGYNNNNNYNNNNSNYNNNNTNYSPVNGSYTPYKQQQVEGGPPQNGNYYRNEGQQQQSPGRFPGNNQAFPGGNKMNPHAAFKENDPYAKRNVPDRSDTKQWINFLGN